MCAESFAGWSWTSDRSSRSSLGGPAIRWSPAALFFLPAARADSSVCLMTAAGEMVVGDVSGLIFCAFVRFTIFGAPRTTVRPSSSSSSTAANLPERFALGEERGAALVAPVRELRAEGGMPAAGRGEAARALSSASPIDFDGRMFVISSSPADVNLARMAPAGGGVVGCRLLLGLTVSRDVTTSSLVTTSLSPDSSRPGRFVKGSMILRLACQCAPCEPQASEGPLHEKYTVERATEKQGRIESVGGLYTYARTVIPDRVTRTKHHPGGRTIHLLDPATRSADDVPPCLRA